MAEIRLAEALWATSIAPEGVLEQWRRREGDLVEAGAPVATVRIEDALHTITSPQSGRLQLLARENAIIEPGTIIGTVQ